MVRLDYCPGRQFLGGRNFSGNFVILLFQFKYKTRTTQQTCVGHPRDLVYKQLSKICIADSKALYSRAQAVQLRPAVAMSVVHYLFKLAVSCLLPLPAWSGAESVFFASVSLPIVESRVGGNEDQNQEKDQYSYVLKL